MIPFQTLGPDDERDTARRKSAYVSGKEVRTWIIIFALIIALSYFFWFRSWKANRDFVVAKNHLGEIHQALGVYMAENNEGLPAVFLPGVQDIYGRPVTWANQLFQLTPHLDIFTSPSIPPEGDTLLTYTDPNGGRETIRLSYGLLTAAGTLRRYEVRDETYIIAESISNGVLDSLNPLPLGVRDGFAIGYNDSNTHPTPSSEYVTRVAFIGAEKGAGLSSLEPIHDRGVPVLQMDGHIQIIGAGKLKLTRRGNLPTGNWVP